MEYTQTADMLLYRYTEWQELDDILAKDTFDAFSSSSPASNGRGALGLSSFQSDELTTENIKE
jgi:hypothetical protein